MLPRVHQPSPLSSWWPAVLEPAPPFCTICCEFYCDSEIPTPSRVGSNTYRTRLLDMPVRILRHLQCWMRAYGRPATLRKCGRVHWMHSCIPVPQSWSRCTACHIQQDCLRDAMGPKHLPRQTAQLILFCTRHEICVHKLPLYDAWGGETFWIEMRFYRIQSNSAESKRIPK